MNINGQRLLDNLTQLAEIGATADGGVSRPALSEADVAGRAWFKQTVEAAGLLYRDDGAGNQSAVLPASESNAKTLLIGSHLDSVPNGGRYDGALGTLAALEVAQTLKESGQSLPLHLEVISFTDEEGTVMGLFGSQALAGLLTPDAFQNPRGGVERLRDGMARLGLTQAGAIASKRESGSIAAFVELHIEQGTRLEEAKLDIGVVTSIVGIRSFWLTFQGQAAHAGTTPMDKRADAFIGAADFGLRARQLVMADFSPGVVNVGKVELSPGAFNIVPAQATVALEFRHGTEDQLDSMQLALLGLAQEVADSHGLTVDSRAAVHIVAAPMDDRVVDAIGRAADELGLSYRRLMSFAGHDTQAVSRIAPAAMFFVPSVKGISHNPQELTHDSDVINGGNVMLHTVLRLMETFS